MKDEVEEIWDIYFKKQQHLHLSQLLIQDISEVAKSEEFESPHPSLNYGRTFRQNSEQEADKTQLGVLVQVTTYSQPLAPVDVSRLCRELEVNKNALIYMYLEELDAEADFTDRIRFISSIVNTFTMPFLGHSLPPFHMLNSLLHMNCHAYCFTIQKASIDCH